MAKKRGRARTLRGNVSHAKMAKMTRRGVRNNHKAVHKVLHRQGT